ncbi:MAG: hypothetical protein U1E76_01120 [Planctomycetota bacterium]
MRGARWRRASDRSTGWRARRSRSRAWRSIRCACASTGQDTARGTFSQRHAVLHDHETGARYQPLQHVAPGQKPVEIYDSPLAEVAPLGFEYGYTLDYPECLVLWEAQFGDFVNVAQVIIDQFLASGEDKWHRLSGLVLLLPHGFEGQGPEHSHARLERFLALAADDNIQVANPTTPAQYFHLLRRQALRRWVKPLIVMTPKSLLRHPRAISSLADLTTGTFRRVLADPVVDGSGRVDRVLPVQRQALLRSARGARAAQARAGGAGAGRAAVSARGGGARRDVAQVRRWDARVLVQEEPENMGAWRYLQARFGQRLLERFPFASCSRPASASPATGSHASHLLEQQELIDRALG